MPLVAIKDIQEIDKKVEKKKKNGKKSNFNRYNGRGLQN